MLILAAILGTSAVVRLWPVDGPVPLLASRPIHLYEAPVAPPSTMAAVPVRVAQPAPARSPATAVVSVSTPVPLEVVEDAAPIPPEIAAADVQIDAPPVVPPVVVDEPTAIADVSVPEAPPVAATVVEAAPPVPTSSRGIVELPAVAVTRAVTVAGRGIMTGLRATGAMFRAAF